VTSERKCRGGVRVPAQRVGSEAETEFLGIFAVLWHFAQKTVRSAPSVTNTNRDTSYIIIGREWRFTWQRKALNAPAIP